MPHSAVIREPREIVKRFPAVLALVDAIASVSLDVRPEVVPASVPLSADVAGERLLSRVNSHMPTKVCGADEAMVAHIAHEWTVRFPFLRVGLDGDTLQLLLLTLHLAQKLHRLLRHRTQLRARRFRCCHGRQEV